MKFDQLAHFYAEDEANKGSDRVCGIVLGAAVHDALRGALTSALLKRREHSRKLLSPDGPLGNWGLMNDLAHSIGLLSDDVWNDLDCVRRIRNKFAHWGAIRDSSSKPKLVTFFSDENKDLARNLKCPEILPPVDFSGWNLQDENWVFPEGGVNSLPRLPSPTDPRKRFELACRCLIHLCGRIEDYCANVAVGVQLTFDYAMLNKDGHEFYESSDS